MTEQTALATRFEAQRDRLRGIAFRMLGSSAEAEDAVQDAWLRLARVDASAIDNLEAWLTTVVTRVCLGTLRARRSHDEHPLEVGEPAQDERMRSSDPDPEHEAVLADSVGLALLLVLDTLNPVERTAFVLHDMFGVPFGEVGEIVGRSPEAARQLASRARRRVHTSAAAPTVDVRRQRGLVDAFLAAARHGDFDALLAVLDPDIVLRADAAAAHDGTAREVRGAWSVASGALAFAELAQGAQPAWVGSSLGVVSRAPDSLIVLHFSYNDFGISAIEIIADRERLNAMDRRLLDE